MRGMQAIERVVKYNDIDTVLDIGSWNGEHASYLRNHGKTVAQSTLMLRPTITVTILNLIFHSLIAFGARIL